MSTSLPVGSVKLRPFLFGGNILHGLAQVLHNIVIKLRHRLVIGQPGIFGRSDVALFGQDNHLSERIDKHHIEESAHYSVLGNQPVLIFAHELIKVAFQCAYIDICAVYSLVTCRPYIIDIIGGRRSDSVEVLKLIVQAVVRDSSGVAEYGTPQCIIRSDFSHSTESIALPFP